MDAHTVIINDTSYPRVKVSEVLKRVNGSVDFYSMPEDEDESFEWWKRWLTSKCSDTGFNALIDRLLDEGWREGSAVGIDMDDDGWRITEGHHRLGAAILLCMDEIPYDDWGADDEDRISTHRGSSGGFSWEF